MWEKPVFPFADTTRRLESREKPQRVYNVMRANGLPERKDMQDLELKGENAVIRGFKPLSEVDCPNVVIGIPHAGELIPGFLKGRFTPEGEETLPNTDLGTPELFKSEKIPWAQFKVSRWIVDPNRPPVFEAKEKLKEGEAPGKTVLWTEGLHLGRMYKEGLQPSAKVAEILAERYYLPYYNAIMSAIGSLADRRKRPQRERILLVDGHSFPMTSNTKNWYDQYGIEDMNTMPIFILGTKEGKGCDDDIIEAFEVALEKNYAALPQEDRALMRAGVGGPLFIRNYHMKGVHNVQFWSDVRREHGINAIQVECNEGAYIDRDPPDKWESFKYSPKKQSIMQKLLEKTLLDIDPILKGSV